MATRFTLTITTSNTDGATQRSECCQISEMLERASQLVGSTHKPTATITDRNGNATCSYVYSPTAPA
jgi:hypothetical protein